jgi:SP family galactose:H+ symporter-like MFS transporter
MVAPMYAAEDVAPDLRGAIVSLYQLAITIGILAAYATPLFLNALLAWHQLIGIGIIIGCLGLAVTLAIPESPRWLSAKGRIGEAEAVARFLGVVDFAGHVAEHTDVSVRWSGLRAAFVGSVPMVLAMCGGLFILQNLSGIDGILYYAPKIFEELGFDRGVASLAATFLLGGVNVFATIGAIAVVDRLGRRPLLIVGSALMIVGLSGVVISHLTGSAMMGLVGLCLYIAAFAISLGPLPYVLMSELFPSGVREPGIAAASATSWLFNAIVAFFFLSAVKTFGSVAVFGFFTAICVVSLLVGLALLPETKGVPLHEIETKVRSGTRLRSLGR